MSEQQTQSASAAAEPQEPLQQTADTSPPSEVPVGAAVNEPFRFEGDRYAAWMRGRTADEVAEAAQNLYDELTRLSSQPPSSAPEPTNMSTPGALQPPDPQLIYTDAARYQRELIAYQNALYQQQFAAQASPIAARLAETDKQLSRNGRYADVWKRWESEIEAKLAGIPIEQRNLALYDQAAQLVRADHIDELAQERAEQLQSNAGAGTERSGGNTSSPSYTLDKLDEVYDGEHPFFVNAREQRVTKDMIREHCRKMKISVDEFVANSTLGNVLVGKNGFSRSYE